MLFITNRQVVSENNSDFPKKYKFDLDKNAPTNEVFFSERKGKDEYYEIGSKVFLQSLRESKYKQILLYIHGFNNLPEEDIFPNTKILQNHFDKIEKDFVQIVPVIWPCDNDLGVIKDYYDDRDAANMSNVSFERALNLFRKWSSELEGSSCYKFVNMLSHSMGNRVLRESLIYWRKYSLPQGVPKLFRNVFLMAPDLNNSTLDRKADGEVICQSGRNVIVYHANDDMALRASKVANAKNISVSVRLGQTGPDDIKNVPPNVYTVDCDEFNNDYDSPKGHTYYLAEDNKHPPNLAVLHMYSLLKTGRFSDDDRQRKIILK